MFKTLFRQAVRKYLNTTSPTEANRAKAEIIELVSSATDSDAPEQIQEVLTEFGMLTEWLENHFDPGSLYTDRGLTYGWWRDDQLQAESLPVKISKVYSERYFGTMEVLSSRNGFRVSVPLPLLDDWIVRVPGDQTSRYARYGWANALLLQWHRTADGYTVDRSIIACGFCRAWDLRPDAAEYYAKHPPADLQQILDCDGVPATDF